MVTTLQFLINKGSGAMKNEKVLRWILCSLAVANVLNGLWMLVAPEHWYYNIPAGVPDTGALNVHFIRDIGSAYITCGVAFALAACMPLARFSLMVVTTTFYFLHACGHIFDIVVENLPDSHIYIDMPLVFIPVVFLLAITGWCYRLDPAM